MAQPFDSMHKQTSSILIKRNVTTKEWEVNLLDQSDTEFFIEQLASHRETKLEEGWEVVLYDLRLGIIEQGPGELTAEEIEQNEEAAHLIAQTKFFNGITEYSPLEKKTASVDRVRGIQKMRTLFADGIMRHCSNRTMAIEFMEDKFFNKIDI